MSREQKAIIAYHEAGHAVMAMANGFRVTRVTCVTNADSQGRTEYEVPNPPTMESHRGGALVAAAGLAADRLHAEKLGVAHKEDSEGYFGDQNNASVHLHELGHDGQFTAYVAVAHHFLGLGHVWNFVERLAELLIEIGEINGRDSLYSLFQQVPRVSPMEFQVVDLLIAKRAGRIG
ncbi:hypothetical protein CRT60_00845 [Azospirillum palustre]|uniref:Peptidase M41 domain-containing protein n=1 Tax=Azospirillum palustre TaxID=2044885 RepID=A0A2B8BP70_9PROT|nr:hypothetical protein [Azospirillum palustre]PGH59212.1 hypothetical protein CRT60_00845 [Azospirillum palustre]